MESVCDLAVRGINQLLDHQDYPMEQAERATKHRRPLGVGIINLAYWLAKHDLTYTEMNFELLDEWVEKWSYSLIKASMNLAKEKGAPCSGFGDTQYSLGSFPHNRANVNTRKLTKRNPSLDWQGLEQDVKTYGMLNSTLHALMPSESSSQIANATSSLDPIRSLISFKQSKDGILAQVVPEYRRLKNKYQTLWDMPHTRGYLEVAAIIQKWVDQSISTNTSYNPSNYPDGKVPMSELMGDLLYAHQLGIKTLYYNNVNDMAGEEPYKQTDDDCESCKL
jgi:ribonucleoside-diphosphate reductase alpha chain